MIAPYAPSAARLMGSPRKLFVAWILANLAGLAFLSVFGYGLYRDGESRDVKIPVSLGADGQHSESFRIWRSADRDLWLTSINHAPPFGIPFGGSVRVRLATGDGTVFHDSTYTTPEFVHERPDNMEWSDLGAVDPHRGRWTLDVEVQGDPRFEGVFSHVHLRVDRPSVGMGGIVTYVMLFPAKLLLFAGLVLSVFIDRRGGPRWPFMMSLIVVIGGVVLIG